ncbi:MAG: hypothetical protein K9J16_16250 [Melioribacteraceae bacterium]|nr:hypothetical protein [Melioribacteraceae bacterium]MCF8355895.1 hypothetical protein [Melioribacteraceae bacterium]MCF8395196.1 hypothetical protein [Melioribacteraceae bacterium]MCF8420670.1 hypothetical protein [Melioribacteraceae bacterium]
MNPFILSVYHTPKYFCDRNEETKRILSAIHNGRNITLYSLRRIGKSGLIKHVFYKLKSDKKLVLIYMDILATQNINDFLNVLGASIIKSFPTKRSMMDAVAKFFGSLRTSISFDPLTGIPQVQFDINNKKDLQYTLDSVFDSLNKINKKVVIAIDEFQQIINYPEKNVEALLRSKIQMTNNIVFIFSGSRKHLLVSVFGDKGRPFFGSSEMMSLGKIKPNKYASFINKHFEANNLSIEKEAMDFILSWTRGHTFYIQYLCNKLFEKGQRSISVDFVKNVCALVLEENSEQYNIYKNLLTNNQWSLMKAIAKEQTIKMITSHKFIEKYRLNSASSVQTSLKALLNKEMIFYADGFYQIYDVYFSRWLERN